MFINTAPPSILVEIGPLTWKPLYDWFKKLLGNYGAADGTSSDGCRIIKEENEGIVLLDEIM